MPGLVRFEESMMAGRILLLLGLVFLLQSVAQGEKQVVLFGGGSEINNSQASIELNSHWILDILQRRAPATSVHLLYSDGNAAQADVRGWRPVSSEKDRFHAIARVFGKQFRNGFFYYNSHIGAEVAPADAKTVTETLQRVFKNAAPMDDITLIYQGHGGLSVHDTNRNYLQLWGETRISALELEKLMSQADPKATIRFVLPQCYSGAFTRLIYHNLTPMNSLAEGTRCGFVAQREDKESEGCTDSIDTGDYRDYSTYFFSALDGKTRNHAPLAQNADWNGDGRVTFREAHLYTLANAFSVDFSRSTSETYLQAWQPWYLRWLPSTQRPDNVYSRVAQQIEKRVELNTEGGFFRSGILVRIGELETALSAYQQEQTTLESRVKKTQHLLQRQLYLRWPALSSPYTDGFRKLSEKDYRAIRQAIETHPKYETLKQQQDRIFALKKKTLHLRREIVQFRKIIRMRHMARLYEQFQRYANGHDKSEFQRLLSCEDGTL